MSATCPRCGTRPMVRCERPDCIVPDPPQDVDVERLEKIERHWPEMAVGSHDVRWLTGRVRSLAAQLAERERALQAARDVRDLFPRNDQRWLDFDAATRSDSEESDAEKLMEAGRELAGDEVTDRAKQFIRDSEESAIGEHFAEARAVEDHQERKHGDR